MNPVFLIGPARSGTKMMRDTLASHPEINKIGYDINFIWKKGNEEITHDCLLPGQISKGTVKFIQKYFEKQAAGAPILVEKTVSNTLRIPFVHQIFPEAKYIFLFRDGRDTVESVVRQWGVAPSKSYLIKKFLSVPFLDIFPYLFNYAIDLLRIKLGLNTTDSYVWGVKYIDFEKDLKTKSNIEFCATQWNQCINAMLEDYPLVASKSLIVHYEKFVDDTNSELQKVGQFLNLDTNKFDTSNIRKGEVGKAKRNLNNQDYNYLENLLAINLRRLKYM